MHNRATQKPLKSFSGFSFAYKVFCGGVRAVDVDVCGGALFDPPLPSLRRSAQAAAPRALSLRQGAAFSGEPVPDSVIPDTVLRSIRNFAVIALLYSVFAQ